MNLRKILVYTVLTGAVILQSCQSGYTIVSVEGGRVPITDVYDKHPDANAEATLAPYKAKIDSIMTPVIGYSAAKLTSYRPESPLSNLIADLLRSCTQQKTGVMPDVGVMNIGGIRNILNKGEITVGNIYEISPFQNALAIVTMKGDVLTELFQQIASVHGEGLSGANLEITQDGKLLKATVNGKAIDPTKSYQIATIDYLAEGNDKLEAFKKAESKTTPSDAVLRDLFIDYVRDCQAKGKFINSSVEGRIRIIK